MKTYTFDGYTVTLQALNKRMKTGQIKVAYEFKTPEGETLFKGEDLGASPLHAPESLDSAKALLNFLTLKPGDTDEDYFDSYTARQMEFANSIECENLQIFAMEDYDEN